MAKRGFLGIEEFDAIRKQPGFYPPVLGDKQEKEPTENQLRMKLVIKQTLNTKAVSGDMFALETEVAISNESASNLGTQLCVTSRPDTNFIWLPADIWDGCDFEIDEKNLAGKCCFVGLFLSPNTGISGYEILLPPDNDCKRWRVLPRFFLPHDNIEKCEDHDQVPYNKWVRDGFITATEGKEVDQAAIKKKLREDATLYNMQKIVYDRWTDDGIPQRFMSEVIPPEKFISFGLGFASMSAPSKKLKKLLLEKKLSHGGNPVLKWMAGNVAIEMDVSENIKPSMKYSKGNICGIIMLLMALAQARPGGQ